MKRTFNNKKFKTARILRGKTIEMLAVDTEINKKDLLAFEENKYKPTVENEMKISNALNFPKMYFFTEDRLKITIDSIHIRPESRLPRIEEIAYKERLVFIHKIFAFAENYVKFPQMEINFDMNKNDDIENLASSLRKNMDLGNKPIVNMMNLLEANGFIITDQNVNKKNALSFTQKQTSDKGTRYFISLGNDRKDLCSRNVDLAYELAYVLGNEIKVQQKKFRQDELALAFLLPKEEYFEDFENINELDDYLPLKRKWAVPIWALITRAHDLGFITYKKYTYLLNEMDKRGWSKKEPIEGKGGAPVILKQAIDVILEVMTPEELVDGLGQFGLNIYKSEIEDLFGLKKGRLGFEEGKVVKFK